MTQLIEFAAQIYYPDGLIFAALFGTLALTPFAWKATK